MTALFFYNKVTIHNIAIHFPDIYFTPEYGELCEVSDNAEWECCLYKDLIYVYLKRPIEYNNDIYYDLITPYGYSGYYYTHKTSYDVFILLFRDAAINRNYITEVVRQNPYIGIELNNYILYRTKQIYAVEIDDFDIYFNTLSHSIKNKYTQLFTNCISYEISKLTTTNLEYFYNLYIDNMKRINANEYYYFNNMYFTKLKELNDTYMVSIFDQNKCVIGCAIIIIYNNYVHYHLSCNNNSINSITDFLLINVIKDLCINNKFILGGGLTNDDGLSKFKKKFSNKEYKYNIYTNILNTNIYNKLCNNLNNEKFPCYR